MFQVGGEAGERTGRAPQTVRRAMDLLDLLATAPQGLALRQASESLGLARSTAYRLLSGLVSGGLVELCPESRRYKLDLKVLELSAVLLAGLDEGDLQRYLEGARVGGAYPQDDHRCGQAEGNAAGASRSGLLGGRRGELGRESVSGGAGEGPPGAGRRRPQHQRPLLQAYRQAYRAAGRRVGEAAPADGDSYLRETGLE